MSYYQENEPETIYHHQTKDKCTMNCVPKKSARITELHRPLNFSYELSQIG